MRKHNYMRKNLILSILLFISIFTFAQEFFTVEGKKVNTAFVTKIFTYSYSFKGDSVILAPLDSQLIYQNKNFTVEYSVFNQISPKIQMTNIAYMRKNGQDSVRRTFKNNVLTQQYLSKYDSYNRLSSYSVLDKEDASKNADWTYHYEDKRTSFGRISSKLHYSSYAKKLKSFEFRTDVYYDAKGDTIKIMRVGNMRDSSLVYTKKKIMRKSSKMKPSVFRQETVFTAADKADLKKLISKQLGLLKFKLKDPTVRYVENEYYSADRSLNLLIRKTKDERSVVVTIIEVK